MFGIRTVMRSSVALMAIACWVVFLGSAAEVRGDNAKRSAVSGRPLGADGGMVAMGVRTDGVQ